MLRGERGSLTARAEVELIEDTADMVAGGVLADHQLAGDLLVSQPISNQRQHLSLASGEQCDLAVLLGRRQLPDTRYHLGGDGWVKK